MDLILLAFISGNSSLEPLLEGLLPQINIDVSFLISIVRAKLKWRVRIWPPQVV